MSRNKVLLFLTLAIGCNIFAFGCSDQQTKPQIQTKTTIPQVTVADPVLCSQLEGLIDSKIEFVCPQVSSEGSLDRNQIREIQDSQLIVLDATHGNSKWSQQVSLPRAKTIFSTFMVLDQLIAVSNLATHTHGPGQPHSHAGIVSETWLDPELFGQQIDYVLSTLKDKNLITADEVTAALKNWNQKTMEINRKIDELAERAPIQILVDQAGLEYLGRRLGWKIEIVVLETAIKNDPALLKTELLKWRKENPQGRIVMLNEPSPPLAALFMELKESFLKLDTSSKPFTGSDYIKNLTEIVNKLTSETAAPSP